MELGLLRFNVFIAKESLGRKAVNTAVIILEISLQDVQTVSVDDFSQYVGAGMLRCGGIPTAMFKVNILTKLLNDQVIS